MRALKIQSQVTEIAAIQDLTSVFESIASLRISQVKDRVTRSTDFFHELWQLYTQLRIDPKKRLIHRRDTVASGGRDAFILLTSEGGLSGDIDQKIVVRMLQDYDVTTTDILAVGGHGAVLLGQRDVAVTQQFRLPEEDSLDVSEIIQAIRPYRQTAIFYEQYESLMEQSADRIDLVSAVEEISSKHVTRSEDVISSQEYVFEPSLETVIEYMESVMMEIALSQTILESRLAQYASRFKAMSQANDKAGEMKKQLNLEYHRAKRSESDERLKEIVQSVRRAHG